MEADCYGLERITFAAGDVVVDIGGHVGVFAMYLAKRFPNITIYSYEPEPLNYRCFVKNITANFVTNVRVFNRAVTSDRRPLPMLVHWSNTGGATAQLRDMNLPDHERFTTESVTLDDIFLAHGIQRCRLLKIDCEGSEHEILLRAACLDRVDYLSGEFHINEHLAAQGHSIERLEAHCRKFIPSGHIQYSTCHMAE